MRLIDADALREQISETYEYEFPTASGGFDEFATKIIPNIINNAITIDAVPVVRGRWEITDAYPHWMCCSVCHKAVVRNIEVIERYEIPTSFCPNCGCKMEDKP